MHMDVSARNDIRSPAWRPSRGIHALSKAIQRWSKALQQWKPQAPRLRANPILAYRRAIYGTSLLAVSAGLASWAYDLASLESVDAWHRAHAPDEMTWTHALGGRGFSKTEDGKPRNQALRSMPVRI